jgi:hypothetical protein
MISPEQEESMAKQIKATTIILSASHAVMLSHPKEVAKVIEEALPPGRTDGDTEAGATLVAIAPAYFQLRSRYRASIP